MPKIKIISKERKSNNAFSKLIEVKPNRVSKLISSLKRKGYIRVKIKYKENSKEIETREIIPIVEKANGYCSKEQEGMVEKVTDINSNINNNYNNIFQMNNKFIPYKNQAYADLNWNEFYAN